MRDKIFFSDKFRMLPFFLRFFKREAVKAKPSNVPKLSEVMGNIHDEFPFYETKLSMCKRPKKPISKLLHYDEQKDF